MTVLFASTIDYDKIDKNMRLAVELLNQIPGMRTLESCGGHRNRKGGMPYNSWLIVIEFDANAEGWSALMDMRLICSDTGIALKIDPVAWTYPAGAETPKAHLFFSLWGDYPALRRLEEYLS